MPESTLAIKPSSLTHEEAASIPLAALTAWQALVNQGRIRPGARVLIHAAAGGVGIFAVQIAKAFGAYVAATASARNHELLRSLGADLTINYATEHIADKVSAYDIVLDGVGRAVWPASFRALRRGGRLVSLVPPAPQDGSGKLAFFAAVISRVAWETGRAALSGKRLMLTMVKPRGGDLEKIAALIEAGKLRTVIEAVFPLEQVAQAHRLSQTGHVRGKLVIKVV
jgi:NADPH:quinone reductase-like Zn-dependent oxidoreductase